MLGAWALPLLDRLTGAATDSRRAGPLLYFSAVRIGFDVHDRSGSARGVSGVLDCRLRASASVSAAIASQGSQLA